MRYEIRLAGSGGQGLILAGLILAEALALNKDWYVVQTESYGPEARGGASKSDIIFSDTEIFYPKTRRLDLLLALSQRACDEYLKDLAPHGTLIVDSWHVKKCPREAISLPLSQTSRQNFNTEMFTNIISLGAISAITKIVAIEELRQVLPLLVPRKTFWTNTKALNLGWQLGREWLPRQDSNLR